MSRLTDGVRELPTSTGSASGGGGFFADISDRASKFVTNTRERIVGDSVGYFAPNDEMSTNQREIFGLTFFQRWVGAIGFLVTAFLCFFMAIMGLPWVIILPSKFATNFSLGSIMTIISISLMNGPRAHFYSMFSRERIFPTVIYFSSIILTIAASVVMKSYILTILMSVIQIIALVRYVTTYLPSGGLSGLQNSASGFSMMRSVLPI